MSDKIKIYLSGAIESDNSKWRNKITSALQSDKIDIIDPYKIGLDILEENSIKEDELSNIKISNIVHYRSIMNKIIQVDIEAMSSCDCVVVYWDANTYRSAGTQGEITLAHYLGKPVYIYSKIHYTLIPGWIIGCASEIFTDLESLKKFLVK